MDAVRKHIRDLNKLLIPPYETREELEEILDRQLADPPEFKEAVLADFDRKIEQLAQKDAASIAQFARNERAQIMHYFTEAIVSDMEQHLAAVVCRAITADILLAGYYAHYWWACWQGASEEVADKLRPTKVSLRDNVIAWLGEMLTDDFIARETRGRNPKPQVPTDEKEKAEWTEKVINAYIEAKGKLKHRKLKVSDIAEVVIQEGETSKAKTRTLYRRLESVGLEYESLKLQAEMRLMDATKNY